MTYRIYYKSTNESLLKYLNNRWEVQVPVGGEEGKFYPVQLSARIYGVYQNKIISYTLERWHINVTYDGNVNIADPNNDINVGYWKTLNAAPAKASVRTKICWLFYRPSDGEASSSVFTEGRAAARRPIRNSSFKGEPSALFRL
jgi:hypothetical protein